MVVNGAGAAGPAVFPAAKLVSCKRPSAPLLLLPGPAAPLALWPAEPVFLSCGALPSPTGGPVLPQHSRTASKPFEMTRLNQVWKLLLLGLGVSYPIFFFQIHRDKDSGLKTIFRGRLSLEIRGFIDSREASSETRVCQSLKTEILKCPVWLEAGATSGWN